MPEVNGVVRYVSADVVEDPRSGMAYFVCRVEVPDDELKRLAGVQVQPGMFADVFIRTGERTPAQYLLHPLLDSFRRAWLEE
jgi:multidrug efflux pump subunit AcrA (membrane-fusion protein)